MQALKITFCMSYNIDLNESVVFLIFVYTFVYVKKNENKLNAIALIAITSYFHRNEKRKSTSENFVSH